MQVCDIEQPPQPQTGGPFATRNAMALLAVCLAALMFGLEISSVPVILPTLEVALHGDFGDMQWIMNAYTIACAAVLMAAGTLADRYGRKRIFLCTIALFGVASLLCGLAWDMPVLIASRFLQGASGGAMLICLVAVLSHQFPAGAERARAFGIWGIVFGIGLGFGPLIGGLIVAVSSWQWVFWAHVFIAALTLGLAVVGVRESVDPHAGRLDLAGIVTLSLAVLGLVYFVTQGPEMGFGSVPALSVITASAASFVLFLIVETRAAHPMFDFSVFRVRNFSGALLGSVGMNFSFWPFIVYLPIYFQSALGQGPAAAGVSLLAYTLPTLVFPPIGERLALRYQPGIVIPAGLLTIGLGFFLMLIGSHVQHASWLTVLPGCLLAGAGLGITNTPVTNTTTGSVSSARAGMASGIDMSARMISLAINIALMGFVLVQGVLRHLQTALDKPSDAASLRALANSIASGSLSSTDLGAGVSMSAEALAVTGRAALVHGFSGIMLYSGIAVCVLAGISFLIFPGRRARAPAGACD
ncbi:MFS transporter [Pandoraea pulmonicola]|uniref:MFS transporter n=1 Tax=Pandoraea pulmonicola TaxID=93221 RepID=A0AAJ4Z8C1_PANPU|nr:MFS transporter [Pandoraea pulmonicola]AJC22275.1 MFS transporter [Pandoraea pulmonicola]SUA88662.1 Spectinomycin tetracycline efflux pump [Pandoraea pulmonicola]